MKTNLTQEALFDYLKNNSRNYSILIDIMGEEFEKEINENICNWYKNDPESLDQIIENIFNVYLRGAGKNSIKLNSRLLKKLSNNEKFNKIAKYLAKKEGVDYSLDFAYTVQNELQRNRANYKEFIEDVYDALFDENGNPTDCFCIFPMWNVEVPRELII